MEPGPASATYSAIQLFVDTVRRTVSDFTLTPEMIVGGPDFCRLLDGIPLALELAAGWVRFLSLAEMLVRLEQSLDLLDNDVARCRAASPQYARRL